MRKRCCPVPAIASFDSHLVVSHVAARPETFRRRTPEVTYLARIARANRTEFRSFASLLGRLPGGLPSNPGHLMFTILTLNDAAFERLLAYTGHDAGRLIQAIPSLAPATSADPGESPALRVASLREEALDCPQCRLRREGAFLDTRLFPLKMACVPHGYWLSTEPALAPRHGCCRARLRHCTPVPLGGLANRRRHPIWYNALSERWYDRADTAASSSVRGRSSARRRAGAGPLRRGRPRRSTGRPGRRP